MKSPKTTTPLRRPRSPTDGDARITTGGDLDLALVGGGLQNALIALAVLDARPDARVALFERGPTVGGNHTWCFHQGDHDPADGAWIDPLVVHRWSGYQVAFPSYRRTLDSSYACITAQRLDQVVRARLAAAPGGALHTDAEVIEIEPGRIVVRRDGATDVVRAATVIDARGPERTRGAGGWQKFVGVELELTAPHDLDQPLLMDATVEQLDGFRFIYLLPLGPRRVLVEDTSFSDGPDLDVAAGRARALDYAAARGWQVAAVTREERGVLPLVWELEVAAPEPGLIRGGYQGGWFHPVTGYSFPPAARLATAVATALAAGRDPAEVVAELVPVHRRQLRYALRLVRMMFRWFAPEGRVGVLEHFYRLPEPSITRFYALASTTADRVRMFAGRPPRGLVWRAVLSGERAPASPEVPS